MIENMANVIIKKVSEAYPQISTPTAMKAVITSVKKSSREYKEHFKLQDMSSGEEKDYEKTSNYYVYSIKIINTAGTSLQTYPSMPNIETRAEYSVGDTVIVVFIGGETNPAIVG